MGLSELTEKQTRFCHAYAALIGTPGAATEAAVRAGYSNGVRFYARLQGSRLLKSERIQAEIERILGNQVPLDELLAALALSVEIGPARESQVREIVPEQKLSEERSESEKEVVNDNLQSTPAMITWQIGG